MSVEVSKDLRVLRNRRYLVALFILPSDELLQTLREAELITEEQFTAIQVRRRLAVFIKSCHHAHPQAVGCTGPIIIGLYHYGTRIA